MTAKKMRRKADKSYKEMVKETINWIERLIKIRANEGKYSYVFTDSAHALDGFQVLAVCSHFHHKGFTVKRVKQDNVLYITFLWKIIND